MIISGNSQINKVYYSGYTISKIYACGGSLVWSGDTPTPPTPTQAKWIGIWDNEHIPNSGACNSSSVLTQTEITDNIPFVSGWTWNYVHSLVIGDCVTEIGNNICNSCTYLTAVTIPNTVTKLGTDTTYGSCFQGCQSLSSITIPDSVTLIGGRCFNGCNKLQDVVVPSGVTLMGNGCFSQITKEIRDYLRITILATTPPTLNTYDNTYYPFYQTNLDVIYVPDESVNAYKTANGWSRYADYIKPISEKP